MKGTIMKKKILLVLSCFLDNCCFSMDSPLIGGLGSSEEDIVEATIAVREPEKQETHLAPPSSLLALFSVPPPTIAEPTIAVRRKPEKRKIRLSSSPFYELFSVPPIIPVQDHLLFPNADNQSVPLALGWLVRMFLVDRLNIHEPFRVFVTNKNSSRTGLVYSAQVILSDGDFLKFSVKKNKAKANYRVGLLNTKCSHGLLEGNSLKETDAFLSQHTANPFSIVPVVPSYFAITRKGKTKKLDKMSSFPPFDPSPSFTVWFLTPTVPGVTLKQLNKNLPVKNLSELYHEFGKRLAMFHGKCSDLQHDLFAPMTHCDLNPTNILVCFPADISIGDYSKCTFSVIDWEYSINDYYRDGDLISFLLPVFHDLPTNAAPKEYRQHPLWLKQRKLSVSFMQGYCKEAFGFPVYGVLTTNGMKELFGRLNIDTEYGFSAIYEEPIRQLLRYFIVESTNPDEPDHMNREYK
jgi:hypothetical protein